MIFVVLIMGIILHGGFLSGQENEYVPGEIIVKYDDAVVGNGNEILTEDGLLIYDSVVMPDEIEKIASGELYVLRFKGEDIADIIDGYQLMEEVEYAEPNYILSMEKIPNDTLYSSQWHLPAIAAPDAWNLTTGNKQTIIAVIDTGVDWNHPDLALNIWNNSDELCDSSIDNDHNGYKGDCRGYDFVDTPFGCSDADCSVEDNDPMDNEGHGTHTSGIAAAVSHNGVGVAGVCWNCSIMAVRAGYKNVNGNGVLTLGDAIAALHYAADNNATIISMSFGGSHSPSLQDAISYAAAGGSILVASSGNSGSNSTFFPCAYENVICVASSDENNTAASYSNYGSWVDVAAPGNAILSTFFDDDYRALSGTSMATPVIAGGIGLITSLYPGKNYTEIISAFNSSRTINFSGVMIPLLNAYETILSFDNLSPVVNLVSPSDNWVSLNLSQIFFCNATDWQLKNMTLYVWNGSSVYYSETKNVAGIFNQTFFVVNLSNYGNYKWNCLATDALNNNAYTLSNFSLTLGNITTQLLSPSDNTQTNNNSIYFDCSAETETTKRLANMTFSLWNANLLYYQETKNNSGSSHLSSFNYTFSSEGEYQWNCKAYTNASEFDNGDDNFTFMYDLTVPVITLSEPIDNQAYIASSQTVLFNYIVSDLSDVINCSLFVNTIFNITDSSVVKNTSQSFSADFGPGLYAWTIQCVDRAGNIGISSSRNFTISAPVSSAGSGSSGSSSSEGSSSSSASSSSSSSSSGFSSGSGGGAGGISGSVVAPLPKIYVTSSEQIVSGYTQTLSRNDTIHFLFDKLSHEVKLSEVGNDFIIVLIDAVEVVIEDGETISLNLNEDDHDDVSITCSDIATSKAEITLKKINTLVAKPTISGQAIVDDEKTNNSLKKIENGLYIVILIIILIIIILFYNHHRSATVQSDDTGETPAKKETKKKRKRKK
ncbi:MAG: hypothetical protein RL557_156 [archaeon]